MLVVIAFTARLRIASLSLALLRTTSSTSSTARTQWRVETTGTSSARTSTVDRLTASGCVTWFRSDADTNSYASYATDTDVGTSLSIVGLEGVFRRWVRLRVSTSCCGMSAD